MRILLSYPRSGNHLVRFFIELLSELPTFGCRSNKKDIEIYKNKFSKYIPFNIVPKRITNNSCYHKYHNYEAIYKDNKKGFISYIDSLILIVRNPREVLLRHNNFELDYSSYNIYFNNINY